MARPVVAIVGRPNVGKSTLFNRIVGERISIVEDKPGVTRDRIYAEAEWLNKYFTLIDTGGIEPESKDIILSQMRRQAEIAIETGDVILFVVDGLEGLTSTDREVAEMLRRSGKEVLLVCNKIDTPKNPDSIYEFYELGLGSPIVISAGQSLGLGDLLDEVIGHFPEDKDTEYEDDVIKVAVIGKPNAGKSSLINKVLGENRVIVSDIAGTTRDAIDTPFTRGEDKYVLIDTAGLRRKKNVDESIERYSVIRTLMAIERSDVCVIMIDATEGVTEQDAKIAGYAHNNGKASVIVVNKWDAIEKGDKTYLDFEKEVMNTLSFMTYAPIIFISAKTGQRVNKLFDLIKIVSNNHAMRITTGVLNDIINEAVLMNQPPTDKGKRLKIYYGTQVASKPPKFVIFINDKELMHFSYGRYLENQIRKSFGFEGTPLQFEFNEKKGD
ncbi:GTP-binding protein EngA [Gottschalkia acidurici 9a]|uniref:GTPase Der n=1 Tax=Gottschalkia acidurici (strain ATCC 7906 / DSM 604 / BCRC 14475 / CIP 104303 / KCTC 5404 / NCIMB 10678 / 9a) TaxID=1128398 RepID=K0AY59_GOTA9|nr:ribosome biogenesis GTPase Der [Gottschalkia acidurici]AFS78723.1 GTP-binding protein EngA [Gottschalkia acidurici 9a]